MSGSASLRKFINFNELLHFRQNEGIDFFVLTKGTCTNGLYCIPTYSVAEVYGAQCTTHEFMVEIDQKEQNRSLRTQEIHCPIKRNKIIRAFLKVHMGDGLC